MVESFLKVVLKYISWTSSGKPRGQVPSSSLRKNKLIQATDSRTTQKKCTRSENGERVTHLNGDLRFRLHAISERTSTKHSNFRAAGKAESRKEACTLHVRVPGIKEASAYAVIPDIIIKIPNRYWGSDDSKQPSRGERPSQLFRNSGSRTEINQKMHIRQQPTILPTSCQTRMLISTADLADVDVTPVFYHQSFGTLSAWNSQLHWCTYQLSLGRLSG